MRQGDTRMNEERRRKRARLSFSTASIFSRDTSSSGSVWVERVTGSRNQINPSHSPRNSTPAVTINASYDIPRASVGIKIVRMGESSVRPCRLYSGHRPVLPAGAVCRAAGQKRQTWRQCRFYSGLRPALPMVAAPSSVRRGKSDNPACGIGEWRNGRVPLACISVSTQPSISLDWTGKRLPVRRMRVRAPRPDLILGCSQTGKKFLNPKNFLHAGQPDGDASRLGMGRMAG